MPTESGAGAYMILGTFGLGRFVGRRAANETDESADKDGGMVILKSPNEIERIRAAGRVVYRALRAMGDAIVPGKTTTHDLEEAAIRVLAEHQAESPFL